MTGDQGAARILELLDGALLLPADRRSAWLQSECRGDPALLNQALLILALADEDGGSVDPDLLAVLELPSRYEPRRAIARGGMGIVVEAWDRQLDRPAAVKICRTVRAADGGRGDRAHAPRLIRFLREARFMASLNHPGVPPVHESGVLRSGRPWFAMGLVEGMTLEEAAQLAACGAGGWTAARVAGVLVKAAQAVAHAHARGIVHRDLKPANIMAGRLGEVYVLDWGVAKQLDGDGDPALSPGDAPDCNALLTAHGALLGTPAYMPPEQARGEWSEVDPRADVYALGAVLYTFLAGRPPYTPGGETPSPQDVARRVVAGPPEPIELAAPAAPAELASICARAMSRQRAERYPSCLQLADDLQAYLDGRVVSAHAVGPIVELRKWVRRNRLAAAAVGAALLVAFLGLLAAVMVERRSNRDILAASSDKQTALEKARRLLTASFRDLGVEANEDKLHGEAAVLLATALEQEDLPDIRGLLSEARRRGPFTPVWASPRSPGTLDALAASPDGRRLASGARDKLVRIWNAESMRLERSLQGHFGAVTAVAFDPRSEKLASASTDGIVRVWDVETGKELAALKPANVRIDAVAFSLEGDQLAAAVEGGEIVLCDAATWQVANRWRPGGPRGAESAGAAEKLAIAFVPGGLLALAGEDGWLRRWDTRRGKLAGDALDLGAGAVRALAFEPAGSRLAAATERGEVVIAEPGGVARRARVCEKPLRAVAFLDAAGALAAAGADGSIHVLEPALLATRRMEGHEDVVTALAAAGGRLFSASWDRTLRAWEAAAGREVARAAGHDGTVYCLSFHADGRRLASGGDDRTVFIWDVVDGQPVRRLLGPPPSAGGEPWAYNREYYPPQEAVRCAAFHPTGSQLALGFQDGSLAVIDVDSGEELWRRKSHATQVTSLAFDSGGGSIATASLDSTAHLWSLEGEQVYVLDARDPDRRNEPLHAHAVAFIPDHRLAVFYEDNFLRRWFLPGGNSVDNPMHVGDRVVAMFSSADSSALAFVCSSSTRLVPFGAGAELSRIVHPGHRATSAAATRDLSRLFTAGSDGTTRLWNSASRPNGSERARFKVRTGPLHACAMTRDGSTAAAAGEDGVIRAWCTGTDPGSQLDEVGPLQYHVVGLAASADGLRIATASYRPLMFQTRGRGTIAELESPERAAFCVAHSPIENRIAMGLQCGRVGVWSYASGGREALKPHLIASIGSRIVHCAAFSPDGSRLLAGSADKTLAVIDLECGEPAAAPRALETSPLCAARSPNGEWLAVGLARGTVLLWRRLNADPWPYWHGDGEERRSLRGHIHHVHGVAFNPGSTLLATASGDGKVGLWEPATGTLVAFLGGHTGEVKGVCFSPDGLHLASASLDGTVRVWETGRRREIACLRPPERTAFHAVLWPEPASLWAAEQDVPVVFRADLILEPAAGIRARVESATGLYLDGSEVKERTSERLQPLPAVELQAQAAGMQR